MCYYYVIASRPLPETAQDATQRRITADFEGDILPRESMQESAAGCFHDLVCVCVALPRNTVQSWLQLCHVR